MTIQSKSDNIAMVIRKIKNYIDSHIFFLFQCFSEYL